MRLAATAFLVLVVALPEVVQAAAPTAGLSRAASLQSSVTSSPHSGVCDYDALAPAKTSSVPTRAGAFPGYGSHSERSLLRRRKSDAALAAKAGPDVVRALPRGGATLDQETLEHIVVRHWPTSGAANAGKFASGTTARSLRDMVDTTVRQGTFRPNTAGRPDTIFEHAFGDQIGTNIGGKATSRLRVVVGPKGNVITAFPY